MHHEHPDWTAEIGQRAAQGLAVLATLGEAGARFAAERTRQRAAREQLTFRRHASLESVLAAERRVTERGERLARQRDRRVLAQVHDAGWLDATDLHGLATVWRTARLREAEFPEARPTAWLVEERLRQIYQAPMDLYDRAVAAGVQPAAAMRVAAEHMARTAPSRPHGARRSAAIEPSRPVGADSFYAAVGDECVRLADGVDPETYAVQLERLGVGGRAAAQALRELLADPTGKNVTPSRGNEPPSTGTTAATNHEGEPLQGDSPGTVVPGRLTADAPAIAAQWYPDGINGHQAMPAHVSAKRPAASTTRELTAGRSR
jgi:hypothetical protein